MNQIMMRETVAIENFMFMFTDAVPCHASLYFVIAAAALIIFSALAAAVVVVGNSPTRRSVAPYGSSATSMTGPTALTGLVGGGEAHTG